MVSFKEETCMVQNVKRNPKKDRWQFRWYVGAYTVAMDRNGNLGCSCPTWIFKREKCQHIAVIEDNMLENLMEAAKVNNEYGTNF